MTSTRNEPETTGEDAALLLIRSEQDDSRIHREKLDVFVRSSVHHVRELLLAQATSMELRGIDPQRQIDLESLPVLPELPTATIESRAVPPSASTSSRRRVGWIGIAAAVACLAIGSTAWVLMSADAPRYSTAIGEQRAIKLPDGTIMTLNTASRADVVFSGKARQIRLLDGEALFAVERDPDRPFEVITDNGVVRAIGTQFNVYRRKGITRVSVIEGTVQVLPREPDAHSTKRALLMAGEEAELTQRSIARARQPDVSRTMSWRSRKLAFKDASLEDVAREFNRYNLIPLSVEGDPLRHLMVSGVFDADDAQPIIDFVSETPDLRVEVVRSDRQIVIRRLGSHDKS